MRTGVLWRGGEITMHTNIEQTVTVFLNGRANAGLDISSGPDKLVKFDPDENRWGPLKPKHLEMELICLTMEAWYRNRHKELTKVNTPVTI